MVTIDDSILKINNLHKEFDKKVVLKDINLEIKKGEVTVIIGPSGCGKSTFLRCLNGLETIDGGEIFLYDTPIDTSSKNITKIREKIGMVFQSYDLFPHKTVLENIILSPIIVQKRNKQEVMLQADELLEKVGLIDRKNDFPRQLSGGQKQRIAIVRALIMNPEVLLLDEITAALDPEMVHEVLRVVLSLAKNGSTMIIVTHEMDFAKAIADRILLFDKGEVVEDSKNPKEFFKMPNTDRGRDFLKSFNYE